jgi:hypothetical protein
MMSSFATRKLVRLVRQPGSCDHCTATGAILHGAADGPIAVWAAVENQHKIARPGCHSQHHSRGLRFGMAMPEAL